MAARRTALHDAHLALGARFTEFGGWEMPVRYGSIIDEHRAVREAAGLFDLSHMGQLRITGPGAAAGLAAALVNDPGRLAVGRAGYSLLCTPDGGVIDDLIVYRLGADRRGQEAFLVVPNAANRGAVADELSRRLADHDAALADETSQTSLVAIQGPLAAGILARRTTLELEAIRRYAWAEGEVAGVRALVARTGYTGEDGFEIFVAWPDGPAVWSALLEAGAEAGAQTGTEAGADAGAEAGADAGAEAGPGTGFRPCGLGARDTLRLEAGMPLYGNELDLETTPFEAGLGWAVQLDHEFVGREALDAAAQRPRKRLVGLVLRGRGIARHGYPVCREGETEPAGVVTSGSQSPTLGEAIAMAYVPPTEATPGTMLDIIVRGAAVPAEVVPLPFYRRAGR